MYAWEKGLKSTYYCFIDKTIKGEKYTMNVNKRGERRGFGLAKSRELEELERMAKFFLKISNLRPINYL